ncbi:YiiX/YebB-like N1pC/P60 family cysteine hydrolase [Aurantiacibacter sediminis]|uniref:NlpC/P60 domain-containing protein n=1 Tax=Aurantiacibacter sediminis TaxID=2793064 RepID=A0ABS0N3B7_9SPHN|nr:YiiX/YebB-like N1pC/P60 family cysteine hydrolase [Aurantiacibacter sediminis]MBH5322459.1 hypothetical protein [Aurantiacibacter sediminis]
MPTSLSKLQHRSNLRHARSHLVGRHHRLSRRSHAQSSAQDLAQKLIAAGADPEKARKAAGIIAAAPSSPISQAQGMRLPSVDISADDVKDAVLFALEWSPLGVALDGIFYLCDNYNLAFGVGLGGVIGYGVGGGAGGGIVFGPNRTIALYGTVGVVVGLIVDGSIGAQFTLVHGGLSAFGGTSFTLGGAIGEVGGVSGHVILNTSLRPIGLQIEVEIRGGLPVRAIGGVWETYIGPSVQLSLGYYSESMFGPGCNSGNEPVPIPAEVTDEQAAREILEFFYPDFSFTDITENHKKLAARMLHEAIEANEALDWVPEPSGGRPGVGWLAKNAVKIAWRKIKEERSIRENTRATVARNWRPVLDEIRNGLTPTGLSVSSTFQAGKFEIVKQLAQNDIPLDPQNGGGMSIDWQYLEPGDIILVAREGFPSDQIREATGEDASHAMLYVGVQNGRYMVIESTVGGVQTNPVEVALDGAEAAAAFRYPGLTGAQRRKITSYAARMVGEGRGYHYFGLIQQARFRYDVEKVCSGLQGPDATACRAGRAKVRLGSQAQSDNFICSQLVAESFKQAGVPLTNDPSHWVAPGDMIAPNANMIVDLEYIGHVWP